MGWVKMYNIINVLFSILVILTFMHGCGVVLNYFLCENIYNWNWLFRLFKKGES